MGTTTELATVALRGALETRRRVGVATSAPVCVYDLAEKLGIEVRFCPGNSFGGMYSKKSQTILVPSLRPPGKQAFTCGHELAHWFFEHGDRIDDNGSIEDFRSNASEDRMANMFAGYLLMPKRAVLEAFRCRGWESRDCTALQAYTIACQLNVGYETLIRHMQWSLRLLSQNSVQALLKSTPKALRQELLGAKDTRHLVIADENWTTVAIDLQVGDMAIVPHTAAIENRNVVAGEAIDRGVLVRAEAPGVARAVARGGQWASFIRVSRADYEGRSKYRHLEDPDVNETD